MSFLKGIKDELSHAVNEYVNNENDVKEDDTYSASKEAEEEFRRRRNEEAANEEEESQSVYDDMFVGSNTNGNGDNGQSDENDYMVNTIDGDKNMGNLNGAGAEGNGTAGSKSGVGSEVSLKDIAGDIKDTLNEEKLGEMLNEDKEQDTSYGYGEESPEEAGSKKEQLALASDEVTEITKGTVIDGNIVTDGSANIYGKVRGNLACRGRLFVSGTILGSSRAADITMNSAKIDGDVTSDGNLKIGNGSIIIGNVYGTSAVIAGAIKGDVDIQGPVIIDGTAVIQGNIRSRSIQINNGAAIEGMISQCYAEIDYAALFDKSFDD